MAVRASAAALALGLAAACLGGCGREVEGRLDQPVDESRAYGDTLVQSSIGDISALIPNITTDASSHEIGGLIYDGLVKSDRNLNWMPQLAESFQLSADCRTLDFQLRKNVRWHDGQPFTAADVAFTYETMVNPKTPSPYKDDFEAIERLDVLDPHTVRVTYKRPYAKAIQSWGMDILPKHRLQSYMVEGKLRESPQNRNPVGTGPYRFKEWRPGEKVVLLSNPDYFEGRPPISRIVYRVIPSQATIFLELKAQGVDLAGLTAMQYTRQTEYPAFRKAYRKFRAPGRSYEFLAFNLKDPRFADHRVREALASAIDKREIIDGVVLGMAREVWGPIRPNTWAYTDRVKRYAHDPARARALLAEAGWKDRDGDGLIEDASGRPFAFTIRTNQGNDERKRAAELVQEQLKQVGIKVDIHVIEWASFIKEFVKPRKFEVLMLGLGGGGTDPDQYVIWHSSQTGPDQMNRTGYANPEVDRHLEEGKASCHEKERLPHYIRIQEILAEDLPMIFLYSRDGMSVAASRLRGVDPGPAGMLYNLPQWYVPSALQRYTSG